MYQKEANLVTDRGDIVVSSTGTQQGDVLASMLFSLAVAWIHRRLVKIDGLEKDYWYLDDGVLVGAPGAVGRALHVLNELANESGLNLKLDKCVVYAPDSQIADACRKAAPDGVDIQSSMDETTVLKACVGSDDCVREHLDAKLAKLKERVDKIAVMPQKHEAAALLQWTANRCRVVHICRTIPPRLSGPFLLKFDRVLRAGVDELLGTKLDDNWWRIAKLAVKYGGLRMDSGLETFGADYSVSVSKMSDRVSDILNGG